MEVLQSQLKETQASLAAHVDRIRALEGALNEQETMKREVTMLREMMEVLQRREAQQQQPSSQPPQAPQLSEEFEDSDDDGDDSRSIATITPHELERVDEEDEDAEEEQVEEDEENGHSSGSRHRVDELDMDDSSREQDREHEESDDERRIRREELGRPRTPEPTNLGMKINGLHHPNGETTRNRSKTLTGRSSAHPNQNHSAIIEELSAKLTS
ncbi:hypothetical protein MPER_04131, partial [Moniliophthora perniciosa FA553]